jgi:predicted nucleic acid-binding protein
LAIADNYAEAYHELQKAGRALSQVDILLAAMARCLKATLLTTDHDFHALPDIRSQNWIAR